MLERTLRSSTLLLLFFVSGLSALTYEVVWSRLLGLVTGNSVHSIATVLGTFMGGLALGSYWGGRRAPRIARPIRGYALLEFGIAAAGLLVPFAIDALVPVYRALAALTGARSDSPSLLATRFVLSAAVLLVPTTLMGMTLPYLTRAVAHRLDRIGLSVGALYGSNTFGACAGALIAGFLFIPFLGMLGATIAAAALNVAVAIAALALDRAAAAKESAAAASALPPPAPSKSERRAAKAVEQRVKLAAAALPPDAAAPAPIPASSRTLLVFAFGVAGAASMVDQVVWTRVFSLIVGPTTYAFTLMVSSFILGLALGGFLGGLVIDRLKDRLAAFSSLQALVGLSCLGLVFVLGDLPYRLVQPLYLNASGMDFGESQVLVFGILFALLVVPTSLMGFAFPLVAKVMVEDLRSAPRSVGDAYAGNTLGAIAGSLLGGFVLVPVLGLQKSLFAAALLNGAAALLGLAARFLVVPRRKAAFAPALALPGFLAILLLPAWDPNALSSGLYLYAAERFASLGDSVDVRQLMAVREQVFYKEGVTATVNVEKNPRTGSLFLRVTGKTDASTTDDMRTQLLSAHIPMLLHPEPKDVLVIGLGSGVTLGTLLHYPTIRRADCVEISGEVVEASRFFAPWNDSFHLDPRHRMILDDARNYLLLSDGTYDVITSEPSNPWIAGVGTLFTRESFSLARDRLRDGGLYVQWLGLLKMETDDFKAVIRTFTDVFPESALFSINAGVDYLLAGSSGAAPPRFDWARVRETLADDAVFRHRETLGLPSPEHLLLTHIANGEALRRFAGGGVTIRDDRNRLESSMARNLHRRVPRVPLLSALADLAGDSSAVVDAARLDAASRAALETSVRDASEAVRILARASRDSLELVENPTRGDVAAMRRESIARGLESVLEKFPGAYDASESLAAMYKDDGMGHIAAQRLDAAIDSFRQAVAVKPADRDSRRTLAQLESMAARNELKAGKTDAAAARLVSARTLDPENAAVALLLADCYGRQGRAEDRAKELDRARALDPGAGR